MCPAENLYVVKLKSFCFSFFFPVGQSERLLLLQDFVPTVWSTFKTAVWKWTQPNENVIFCVLIIDLDAHETSENSSSGLLQFEEPLPPSTTPPDPKPPSHHSSPSPPRQRPRYLPCTPTGQCGRGRGQRRGLGRGQMFEDPAVMRMVQGRPSLKVMQIYCGMFGIWLLKRC